MSAISPQDTTLTNMIRRDLYRERITAIAANFTSMDGFITNLRSDLDAIDQFITDLRRQEEQGYDTGSASDTLTFQLHQLGTDEQWFVSQKTTYLEKLYEDLHTFATDIATSAAEIEPRATGESKEDLIRKKMRSTRPPDDGSPFTMGDVESLLATVERLLLELSGDIGSFEERIRAAQEKANRGFQIGNLVVNLVSQQTQLSTTFQANCKRIEAFLELNERYSARALKRIKMVADEIKTADEVADEVADEAADTEDGADADAASD